MSIEVRADEYVLPAARDAGLWLAADCQQEWCTRCAAEPLEGDVDQSNARRYYEEDEESGFVLTRTVRPRSDLRLRAFQYEEILDFRASHDLPPGRSKR